MKHKFSNFKMEIMVEQLSNLLSRKDVIGYVAARNTRLLKENLTEYLKCKYELILKFGEEEIDENGVSTNKVSINTNSPKFGAFSQELYPLGNIEHEIDIMTLKYADVVGHLSGSEILELDWMLVD